VPKRPLSDGVYEHLVTRELARSLAELDAARGRQRRALDKADAHSVLARHLATEVARALGAVPANDRPEAQVAIVNRVLAELRALLPDAKEAFEEARGRAWFGPVSAKASSA
jgi:hypothetical protein